MKIYLTYICLVSLLTILLLAILLLAISNMYVAFSVYAWLITLGCNLTGEITTCENK
ncbi:TPA: pathogenicity island protein [Staphylococcus aureus]|nr:pathogenicity island protein [Staphylococcus aureus]